MSPSCSHVVQRFPHKHTETQSREKEDGSMELAWAAATSGNGSSHWLLLWCLGVICFVLSLWSTCKFRSFTFPRPFETPALSICIWSCITKLMWKSGFCVAETPLCLPAFIFNGDVVYGNCLLLPSTSCKLPSALSRPVVYTCVYAHCCEVQWHVLGKIMSKPSRPAEPVMSPSVLAFSAQLLMWVIIPQSLSAPLLLIFWMKMPSLFQAQSSWGPAACTYGDISLFQQGRWSGCSSSSP